MTLMCRLQRLKKVFGRCPPRPMVFSVDVGSFSLLQLKPLACVNSSSFVFQHRWNVSKNMVGFGSLSCRSYCTPSHKADEIENKNFYEKLVTSTVSLDISFTTMRSELEVIIASGVIISKEGHILTCAENLRHCNGPPYGPFRLKRIQALLSNGETYNLEVIASDFGMDLAILKFNTHNGKLEEKVSCVILSKQNIEFGMRVYLISSPRGSIFSFAKGIVSYPRMIAGKVGNEFGHLARNTVLIQSDIVTDVGSNGGPLFNWRGELIGLHCAEIGSLRFGINVETIFQFLKKYDEDDKIYDTDQPQVSNNNSFDGNTILAGCGK